MGNAESPDAFRITPDVAEKLRQNLASLGVTRWLDVYVEIQSGGREVYISLELAEPASQELIDQHKNLIMRVVAKHLPPKIDGEPSWLVALKHDGETVDTVDALDAIYGV
jgi:hypothetical protein